MLYKYFIFIFDLNVEPMETGLPKVKHTGTISKVKHIGIIENLNKNNKINAMNIYLYLNDEEETQIASFYDLESNPFSPGDVIGLNIEELYPIELDRFKKEYRVKMINDNKELRTMFNGKSVKLEKENKYIDFKVLGKSKVTIEYHCELIQD